MINDTSINVISTFDNKTSYKTFLQQSNLEKIDSGNNFFSFISDVKDFKSEKTQTEVIVHGELLENLFPLESNTQDISISRDLIENVSIAEDGQTKKLLFHKDSKIIQESGGGVQVIKYNFSYLHNFLPVQISCNKSSMAILLKSKDDFSNADKLKHLSNVFKEININLKNIKHTFQSYFLADCVNEILLTYKEKRFEDFGDEKTANFKANIPTHCTVNESDFVERLNDLLGKSNKNVSTLINALKENRIIEGNRLDILQFYQHLMGYESSCNTKLIVLGDFVKNWFKRFESENKNLWRLIYNKTLSFELPFTSLPIKQVAMGENHLLLLSIDGDVYACGDGTKGATGNMIRSFHTTPIKVKFPSSLTKIDKICAGNRHSLAIGLDNNVYSWGCGTCGCLGHSNTNDVFEPRQIIALGNAEAICQIDAANNYSASVTITGQLYVWGNGQFGRLGLESNANILTPTMVTEASFSNNVARVKCGYYCTIVYTKKKEVFIVGEQMISLTKNRETPSNSIIKFIEEKPYIKKINFPLGEYSLSTVCGYQYIASLVKSSENDVKFYIWGSFNGFNKNFYFREFSDSHKIKPILSGVLQIFEKNEDEKALIEPPESNKEIKKIWCSQNNTAILSKNGDVFIFGSFLYKIAANQLVNVYIPFRPKGLKVSHLALGNNHILLTTWTKEIFVGGRNIEGQLGLGYASQFEDIMALKVPENLRTFGVRKCYAAENYSVVLTSNERNRVFVFGDIPFLQNSFHINKQLTPKEMDWGNVEKVSCGPTHILLLSRDINDDSYILNAIGNGMYGKLGIGSADWKNCYEPTAVNLPNIKIKSTKDIKMRTSRFTSGVMIRDSTKDVKEYKLFMWGLCALGIFNNIREIEESELASTIELPVLNTVVVTTPYQVTMESYKYFALNDHMHCMVTAQKNEIKSFGNFYGKKKQNFNKQANLEFEKIYLGLTHGAGISQVGKLFMWGSNIMNKLGLPNEPSATLTPEGVDLIDNETDKLFFNDPVNINKFNKLFESKVVAETKEFIPIKPQKEQVVNEDNQTDEEEKGINEMEKQEDIKNKDDEHEQIDNVFAKAIWNVKNAEPKYDELESILIENELGFQGQIKDILQDFKFLISNQEAAKVLQKSVYNIFNLKMEDKPLQINLKLNEKNWGRYPSCFVRYRENYKALLSTLHTHPCYLLKIYEHGLLDDNSLYKLIKQIFSNVHSDDLSQMLMITLCKGVLEIDIRNSKNPQLESLELMHIENETAKFNLFGRVCKLFFKKQMMMTKIQEIAALYLIGHIYSKLGAKIADCDEELLIKVHPENRKKKNMKININTYQRNSRIEKIFEHIDYFTINLLKKSSVDKNSLFSIKLDEFKTSNLFRLPERCRLLITEIIETLKQVTPDIERIYSWLAKSFSLVIFPKFLKIIENPLKYIAIDTSILIDINLFQTFITKCKDNFYSVAYALRHCFNFISHDESTELSDDETSKQIEKVFKNTSLYSTLLGCIKDIIMDKDPNTNEIVKRPDVHFDLVCLKEFFRHSITDGVYVINISLQILKRLHQVIAENMNKVRVLNEGFDFLDQIFKRNGLLEHGGVLNFDSEQDQFVQFKLKTKTLAIKTPQTLMKCKDCKTILLHDYILANEANFYHEFQFINKSSAKGKFVQVLKNSKKVKSKSERIIDFLKIQLELKKDEDSFKDNMYYMLTLIAIDKRKELFLTEDIISDPSRLIPLMLQQNTTNTVLKAYAEEINETYENMKEQLKYHNLLNATLKEIKNMPLEKIYSDNYLCEIYKRIKYNCEKRFANQELGGMISNLKDSSKISKLIRYNEDIPRSTILIETLSKDMKTKVQPVKEFELVKLFEDRVVFKILIPEYKEDVQINSKLYKILILKNDNFEFEMTLTKADKTKTSLWSCGRVKDKDAKKLYTYKLTNAGLKEIIKRSSVKQGGTVEPARIGNFIEVDPKRFIQKLKKLINTGFY